MVTTGVLAILAALSVLGVGVAGASSLIADPVPMTTADGGMMSGGECGMTGGMYSNMHSNGMMHGECTMAQMQDEMQNCTMQMDED